MAEDIDTLLDEVEDKFCDRSNRHDKARTGDHPKVTSVPKHNITRESRSR